MQGIAQRAEKMRLNPAARKTTVPARTGTSSLAFDPIYAEKQRRYVESLGGHTLRHLANRHASAHLIPIPLPDE